jgi:hypothetical protein
VLVVVGEAVVREWGIPSSQGAELFLSMEVMERVVY